MSSATESVPAYVPLAIRGADGKACYIKHFSTSKIFESLNKKVKNNFRAENFQIEFVSTYHHPDLHANIRAVIRMWCNEWNKPKSHNLHIAYFTQPSSRCIMIEFKLLSSYQCSFPEVPDMEDEEFIVGELDNPDWSDPEEEEDD